MINIGIIGCGKIAQVRHIPEYIANSESQIVAFFDRNSNRAQEISDKYGGKVYLSYQELLDDPSIDAVSVCAANVVHSEITVRALEAGKHVLCEKPMAMTLQECKAMVESAKISGKKLLIGHNQRLTKAHQKSKELIQSGEIGDIVSFKTTFAHSGPESWSINPTRSTWFFDKKSAGLGVMADLGIHKTDLIHFLTGQKIIETTAFVGTIDKKGPTGELIDVDDNAICIYKLENGAIGTMNVSWTCYGVEDNSTIIYGTKGVIKIYADPKYAIIIEKGVYEKIYFDIDQIQTNENQTASGVIDLFVDLIKSDQSTQLSMDESLNSMRVIFASVESAKLGRTVKIDFT